MTTSDEKQTTHNEEKMELVSESSIPKNLWRQSTWGDPAAMDAAAMEEAIETPQINLQPCPVVEHLGQWKFTLGTRWAAPTLPVTSRVITPLTGVIIPVTHL